MQDANTNHAAWCWQHETCNKLQRAVQLQNAACSVQHAACNMQRATCCVQHAKCSGQHAKCRRGETISRKMDRHAPCFPVKTATVMSEHTGVFNTVATCASAASAASSCVAAGAHAALLREQREPTQPARVACCVVHGVSARCLCMLHVSHLLHSIMCVA